MTEFIKECSNSETHIVPNGCDGVHISRLALCESQAVFLRPDKIYVFTVVEGCKKCADLAEISKGYK